MAAEVPSYDKLLWPTLRAVRSLGHSARIDEMVEKAIEQEGFTDEQVAVLHKDGARSEVAYRIAWARTYLSEYNLWDGFAVGLGGGRAAASPCPGSETQPVQARWCS